MAEKSMNKGYTILELIAVITIIGILMGIVVSAVKGSLQQARTRKAEATCTLVEQGLATYYAQKARWPGPVGDKIYNGQSLTGGEENDVTGQTYEFTAEEVRATVKALVMESKNFNPMMDVSGLYVSRHPGETNEKFMGMDFMEAVRGSNRHQKKMKVDEMYFGYPETKNGYFRRFKMKYNSVTDTIDVYR